MKKTTSIILVALLACSLPLVAGVYGDGDGSGGPNNATNDPNPSSGSGDAMPQSGPVRQA